MRSLATPAITAGLAAFAACGLTLALLGLGIPYVAGAALSGLAAGLLVYALGSWLDARPDTRGPPNPVEDPEPPQLAALKSEMSTLRHELRGALSPALMVTDRLLKSEDPLIRRAGDTIVRSIDRATTLLGQDQPRSPPIPPVA